MARRVRRAAGGEPGEVGVGQRVLERRQLVAVLVHLRELLLVLAEHRDRLRVLEDVSGVARGAVGVDRDADRSDLRERQVEERPVEPDKRSQ